MNANERSSGVLKLVQSSFKPGAMPMAVIGGWLLALAFPKFQIASLGWIAPGFILVSALGRRGGSIFRLGYVAGLTHYLVTLYWLLHIPFPAGAVAGWLALSAYLALYPAFWVWLCWKVSPFSLGPFESVFAQIASMSARQRIVWAINCAAVWVALEMMIARFLSGFPWNLLGTSQYQILPLLQIGSMTGVYGISFLMVWFSAALVGAGLGFAGRHLGHRFWWSDLLLPLLALGGVFAFGFKQLGQETTINRIIKIALVQPSIPQTLIFDPRESTNRFRTLIELSELALKEKPDLLVWPEAAVPNLLRYDRENYEAIADLARTHRVWMILGADDAEPHPGARTLRDLNYYNSSFLITPEGELRAQYRKRRLVIFGEYVPLARWLPFLRHLTPIKGGFTPGDQPITFELEEPPAKISVLICFEDVFAHFAREYASPDTDFLLNLTNNGWFGESAAQWQHAATGAFRAVENGLPLVRCTNNGLSCWIDRVGRMHNVYFDRSKDIYQAGIKIVSVPMLSEGRIREATIYNRYGDWFGWSCVGWSALVILGMSAQRKVSVV